AARAGRAARRQVPRRVRRRAAGRGRQDAPDAAAAAARPAAPRRRRAAVAARRLVRARAGGEDRQPMVDRGQTWPQLMLAALGAGAGAQEPLPDLRQLVPIDRIVATVNDTPILQSELNTESQGDIRTEEAARGRKLTATERQQLVDLNLLRLKERAVLAQATKTLGLAPPEGIEQGFRQYLHDEEERQRREFGSMTKYSQELARQG